MADAPVPTQVSDALADIDRGASPGDLESETLEFKSDRGGIRKTRAVLAETASCLANGRGGTVVLGVDDAVAGPRALSGTDLDVLEVRRYIFETVTPGLTVTVDELMHGDTRLLLVGVPAGATVHAVAGRVTRRIGRSCLSLAPDQVAALHGERHGRDPSQSRSARSVDDVDPAAVDTTRQFLRRLGDERRSWARLSDAELCAAMGVVSADGQLLVAGEQLFCSGDSEVVSYQHRISVGSRPDASARLTFPLITAFSRALELISARNSSDPLLLASGQQLKLHRFPPEAVREVVANALVHRRLDVADPVQIEHFEDSLTVTSMGPLVSGVTKDNILSTASRPRNRLLARAFRSLGLIEELGTGVALMYRSMLSIGKSPPVFANSADSVRVSLEGGPARTEFAGFAAQLDDSRREDVEVLLVLRRLCTSSSVSPVQMAPMFQRSTAEAVRTLRRMASEPSALIESVGASSGGSTARYRLAAHTIRGLASAFVPSRHDRNRIEAVVTAHVSQHGRITNRVVRNLFGVGTPRASAILRELVEQQILERTSKAPRGPSVEYGPGIHFGE